MEDMQSGMVDKAAYVMHMVAGMAEGKKMAVEGGIPVLVGLLEVGTQRQKEIAAATLLMICEESFVYRTLVAREGAITPLVKLLQSGTSRTKQKVWENYVERQEQVANGFANSSKQEELKEFH